MAKKKTATGSILAKTGRTAKAGRRRSPNIVSVRDADGKRQWQTASSKSV